jgi:uncharacterized protein YutE (UPF0331/DUF86 family)
MPRHPHRLVRSGRAKLRDLRRYVDELRVLLATARPDFEDQVEKWRAAERDIQLIVEAGLDLAGIFISLRQGPPPPEYKAVARALVALGIIDRDLAERLAEHAETRNRLVHEYYTLKASDVYRRAPAVVDDFANFVGPATAELRAQEERLKEPGGKQQRL